MAAARVIAQTLETIDHAVVTTDGRGHILYMNAAAQAFLGTSHGDGSSLEQVLAALWPDLGDQVIETFDEVRRTGTRAGARCSLRTRGGEIVDLHYTITPTHDGDVAEGVVLLLHDITELTRAEQRLATELRDRVNNNLQSIQGMLAIQADHIADERYARPFRQWQHRVLAMSLVYQHLDRFDDRQRVDFAGYANDLVEQLRLRYGRHDDRLATSLAIAELELGIDTAIPLGLLLTELITNAIEHAFPDGRPGTLEIALRELAPGFAELMVRDDGVGLPPTLDPSGLSTFGFELVRGVGESALGGKVGVVSGAAGTQITLRFPLHHAPDAATYRQ